MITCDFRKKKTEAKKTETTKAKTRKKIGKEKICHRCGLEAKKLFKPQTVSPAMRALGKIDWSTISLHVIIILGLSLIMALVVMDILKRNH